MTARKRRGHPQICPTSSPTSPNKCTQVADREEGMLNSQGEAVDDTTACANCWELPQVDDVRCKGGKTARAGAHTGQPRYLALSIQLYCRFRRKGICCHTESLLSTCSVRTNTYCKRYSASNSRLPDRILDNMPCKSLHESVEVTIVCSGIPVGLYR